MNALARIALLALSLLLIPAPALTMETVEPEFPPEEPVATLEESVEVIAKRLPDRPEPETNVPAHVTVLDRRAIVRSGASSLQDLLAPEAGVVLYDQTGNDLEKTFDLRGFTDGSGVKVYLDGAPVNDTRNNGLKLHLVPLEAVERIEIVRGSAANSSGGGSEAGAIHIRTLSRAGSGGSVSLSVGSDSARRLAGRLHDANGAVDYSVSGSLDRTDGFRENSRGDLRRFHGAVGIDPADGHRLELSILNSDGEFGNPGALTSPELRDDRYAAPFNRLDRADEGMLQAALNYRGEVGSSLTVAANLFHRRRDSEILSTGRSAPLFGGFFLDSEGSSSGSTVQVAHRRVGGRLRSEWTAGLEWLDGSTDSLGYFTSPADPGTVDPASPASVNTTDRRILGLYLRNRLRIGASWSVTAEVRHDRDRIGYREAVPDPLLDRSTTYSETSFLAGTTWSPDRANNVYLAVGESFLPPTVEQLFAFPLFGSNPDLLPQRSRSYEAGWRGAWPGGARATAAVVFVDTEDEIIYLPGAPPDWIGINANAESTRRRGIEATWRGPAGERLDLYANLSLYEAEYHRGPNRGNRVPLVPGERLAAGIHYRMPGNLALRIGGLHVGDQVLDNDDANTVGKLDAYTVWDARLTWEPSHRTGGGGMRLFAEIRNLLDEEYASRGILAWDFSAGADAVFLTPAPGRRLFAGVDWSF